MCIVWIFTEIQKIMSCIVFNLISNPYKYDDIRPLIRMVRIEYRIMRVCRNILYASIETLETCKCWCHSLCYNSEGCVDNLNSAHDSNVSYQTKSVSKFTSMHPLFPLSFIYCQWNWSHELIIICRVCLKVCIKLLNFTSRNHSFTKSMIR